MFRKLNTPPIFRLKGGKLKSQFNLADNLNIYPTLVGLLLGFLQTGLFFQLTLSMSSGFMTYLLITLCWLAGSAIGVRFIAQRQISSRFLLILMTIVYLTIGWIVTLQPFNTQFVPFYGSLIVLGGFYPGVFFARLSKVYTARMLFFWENNGFILGIILSTILFMILGRIILIILPVSITGLVWWFGKKVKVLA
jgi:hypothetical protein